MERIIKYKLGVLYLKNYVVNGEDEATTDIKDACRFSIKEADAIVKTNPDVFEMLIPESVEMIAEKSIEFSANMMNAFFVAEYAFNFITLNAQALIQENEDRKDLIKAGIMPKTDYKILNKNIAKLNKLTYCCDFISETMRERCVAKGENEYEDVEIDKSFEQIFESIQGLVRLITLHGGSTTGIPAIITPDEKEYVPIKVVGSRKHQRLTGARLIYDKVLMDKLTDKNK